MSLPPLELEITPAAPSARRSFGELDLGAIGPSAGRASRPDDSLEADPFGEVELKPPPSISSNPPGTGGRSRSGAPSFAAPASAAAPVVRQAGGGTAYGEVNLNDGAPAGADVMIEAPAVPSARGALPSGEDMEFGDVPQERAAPPASRATVANANVAVNVATPAGVPSRRGAEVARPRSKGRLRILAGVSVVLIAGASLAFLPDIGPFGAYWVLDHVKARAYDELVMDTAKNLRAKLGADTAADAVAAQTAIDRAREAAPRVRGLRAYAAYSAACRELRFGADPEVHARSKVLLDEFADKNGVLYLDLARAARAAPDGQLARARQALAEALQKTPNDPDSLLLSGEVELRAHDANAALLVWTKLFEREPSARAAFGLARARLSAGDMASAEASAKKALELNPQHVGAKILLARTAAEASGREAQAISWLEQAAKQANLASPEERVSGSTLLGDIHLARSRISRAEAAYTEALKINPKAARALSGLGEALYRAGRYSEAQARFEAGVQADPDDVFAKVGVAKSKLMLERLEDAQASLKKLRESHPAAVVVAYWYGRVLEAVGDRTQAEQVYNATIAKTSADPMLGDTYIALALLQNQQGRAEEAQKTLNLARQKLPASAAIHRALGEVYLSQGRYAEAEAELTQALKLDPEDLGARFRLGVTLRRDGKFDAALKVFDEVSATAGEYPGLALERGLIFEALGRTEEALKSYEGALAKAPEDPDLMLRVGCGYASAGRTKEAEALLRKVLSSRPTSAETNHCLGRALLAEGSRLADALRSLERAVELDPHRAEFHLYVGWAANEAGNVPKAAKELDQAISIDQGLADAYWQRGVLRQRQGVVRDAVQDLLKALQLRPTRYEAHAALAEAYFDLGKEPLALAEWQKAVSAQPGNATWRFRYGKLLAGNHMNDAARGELAKALELVDKAPHGERWIWEAHLLLARTLGSRADAQPHWEAFLRLGPIDSPYRAEAKTALEQSGHPWNGN
jgi:tetratricopeptide (TPR) repeat protein